MCIRDRIVIKKKKLVLVKNQAVRQMFAAPFHPALVVGEVKEKRKGSVALGTAVMGQDGEICEDV